MLLQRSVLIFYMLSIFATLTHAQVEIDQSFTIEEYVNDLLLGDGVSASNITLIGDPIQLAKLTEGSGNFSVESGLVLSCGDPNRLMDCGGDANPTGLGDAFDDPDLLEVANSVPPLIGESFTVSSVNDGCVLEFDFEAGGDSISFNYVFGSDEYLNFVNTQYNDIFAFFLSGPGISGPYAAPAGFPDGAINIAQVPNSDPLLPVTISSVNNVTNPEYYIDNQNPAPGDVCINGYTTTFTAAAAVQCGETYHIKLAIADGSDTFLESIVVLEAGSFSSNAVALEAEAVPFAADGLEDIVPYADAIGLPNSFQYPNGETFPFSDWYANNNIAVTVDGQSTLVDAVIIEGCNDAQFTVIRSEEEAAETDTLYLNLAGSAQLGLDYAENFNQVVMGPGQVESIVTLGVVDDGFNEGIETAEITYEYINGCGELISTTSLVVIVDPIPIEAIPATVECQTLDGEQELGYTDMVGYGPFNFEWAGDFWGNATMDPSAWTTSFDSVFVMTDDNGQLIDTHVIQLVVTDQCGNSIVHEQEVLYPVIFETEICGGDVQEFPAYNVGIAVSDVLYNGQSLINTTLGSTPLTVDAMAVGDNWLLESLSADVVELQWSDTLTLVDTCGYVTKAFMRVRDCIIPNVFTPDNSGKNDNFRIRGLDGFAGSKLIVYNRYGTVVYTKETASDAEFELVWNGNFANGNPAPAGVYQWVLLRADGLKDSGELSLMR